MADAKNKYPENVPGKYYVDAQCIDCDLCRCTAPDNFKRHDVDGYSFVYNQPAKTLDEYEMIKQLVLRWEEKHSAKPTTDDISKMAPDEIAKIMQIPVDKALILRKMAAQAKACEDAKTGCPVDAIGNDGSS